jgi:imidazolonepropionase-like amidohydrolase
MKVDGDVGTITPGKYADIIAVKGDVLRYIALLQRVDVVIKRGTRYKCSAAASACSCSSPWRPWAPRR